MRFRFRLRQSALNFTLVVLLAALLAALAVLQYRWIGQTSEAEREKLRKNAELAAGSFSRDFNRELTRAFLLLQVNQNGFDQKNQYDYAVRYERWLAATDYPKMVSRVFIVTRDGGETCLSIYNETTRSFEESAWVPEFARIRGEIESDLSGGNAGISQRKTSVENPAVDVPALVIPIAAVNLPNSKDIAGSAGQDKTPLAVSVQRIGYTIILLDVDYIKKELLPSLTARYFNFAEANKNDGYDVIVMDRNEPAQIFYQSDSMRKGAEFPLEAADVETDLFALKFDEIKNLLSDQTTRLQTSSPPTSAVNPQRTISVSIVTAQSSEVVTQSPEIPNSKTTGAFFTNQRGNWRLLARHRGGSFDTVVETVRRRNLFVSFGILLLLAASGVMLIVLLNRERVLVHRQNAFTASVSHEFRAPLAVIRATSENIADGIITEPERVKEYGLLIGEEERRLSAMVEQMLELAGAGKAQNQPYELRRENIAEIIEAALGDYQMELSKNDFDVHLEIELDLPAIFADRDALRRAFGNIVGNAVKYGGAVQSSKRKSRLEIKVGRVRDGAAKQIEIVVKDNGAGIEKKDLPHVFKLFYRGRGAVEAQTKGNGIGLSLVKQTIKAQGGTIKVASQPGQGSVFTVRFPAAETENAFA